MGIGDKVQLDTQRQGWLKAQADRARPAARDRLTFEMPERMREQPVSFLGGENDVGFDALLLEPLDTERQSLQEAGRVAGQGIDQRRVLQQCGQTTTEAGGWV